jgi:hypothetical protein
MIAPNADLLKELEREFLAGSGEYGDLSALHAVSRAGGESPFPTQFLGSSGKNPDPLGVRHFQELACAAHFAQTGERLDDGWRLWLDRLVQKNFARSKFRLGTERVSAQLLQEMRASGQSTEGFVAEEMDDEDKKLETYLQNFGATWSADNLRRTLPELTDEAANEAAELLHRKDRLITVREFRRALPDLAAELLRLVQTYIRQGQDCFKVERLFRVSAILCGTLRRNVKFAAPEPPPPLMPEYGATMRDVYEAWIARDTAPAEELSTVSTLATAGEPAPSPEAAIAAEGGHMTAAASSLSSARSADMSASVAPSAATSEPSVEAAPLSDAPSALAGAAAREEYEPDRRAEPAVGGALTGRGRRTMEKTKEIRRQWERAGRPKPRELAMQLHPEKFRSEATSKKAAKERRKLVAEFTWAINSTPKRT